MSFLFAKFYISDSTDDAYGDPDELKACVLCPTN
jgi:hypothetical protein